jgi:hypothetical protein
MPEVSRRRVAVAAATAGLVAVTVASAVLLTATNPPQPGPTASSAASAAASPSEFDFEGGGWGWKLVDQPAPSLLGQVANGFLGECVADGRPALCTSSDAVSWTLEPDASRFELAGGGKFEGWSIARGSAGWVAAGTVNPGTWRSADGIHWTAVSIAGLDVPRARVQPLGTGFAMVAEVAEGHRLTPELLLSADGLEWQAAQLPTGVAVPRLAGAIGVVAMKSSEADPLGTDLVSSTDGATWQPLTVPLHTMGIVSTLHLPAGGYLGLAVRGYFPGRPTVLLASADGLAWQIAAGPGPEVESLAQVGGRVFAVARVANSDSRALSESTDGVTWRQIALLDGSPLAGTAVAAVGDRVGLLDGSRLVAVGSPLGEQTAPTASPSLSAQPLELPTPAEPSALVIGGWRWHELNMKPDSAVVRLPGGYLGRCGDSMCTSANGWKWQVPADPAIFNADPKALFTPDQYVRGPAGDYVIMAWNSVWYSPDGVSWKQSRLPGDLEHLMGITAGPAGFGLIGPDVPTSRARQYVSTDGAEWTDVGLLPYLDPGPGGNPNTEAGLLAKGEKQNRFYYAADGRHWLTASVAGESLFANCSPYRLADGRLLTLGGDGLLVSADGRKWTKLATDTTEWRSVVVVDDRIVASSAYLALESTDRGASFHQLLTGVDALEPFGDLALARSRGGRYYVGAPLSASEAPGTTPTATGLPATPASPGPTPRPEPSGGISSEEAVRIAAVVTDAPADKVSSARATVVFDEDLRRWVWHVGFTWYYGGPLNAQGTSLDIDLFSGEILTMADWIS